MEVKKYMATVYFNTASSFNVNDHRQITIRIKYAGYIINTSANGKTSKQSLSGDWTYKYTLSNISFYEVHFKHNTVDMNFNY